MVMSDRTGGMDVAGLNPSNSAGIGCVYSHIAHTWDLLELQMGVSQNYGYLFGGPHNKDYSILGSILGSPYCGK